MHKPFFQKVKKLAKPIGKYMAHQYSDAKTFITAEFSAFKNPQSSSRKSKNIFVEIGTTLMERWRFLCIIFPSFILLYYGLGAAISSKIDNNLDIEIQLNGNTRYTTATFTQILKKQVDETAWTPALPIIFPAAILDNMPNFQLGTKDGVQFFIKRLSAYHVNPQLKNAAELLNYPPNIWLFSRTSNETLAPGSAKQYRKALAEIKTFAQYENDNMAPSPSEFLYLLKGAILLIKKQIAMLEKQVREHSGETLDFKADDIFYYTKGVIYTLHYTLSALSKDYQHLIVESNQYDTLTTALKFLQNAENLSPLSVKNATPEDIYAANHLIYMAFYLSQAENHLLELSIHIQGWLK